MDLFYVYLAIEYEERSERATKLQEAERTLRSSRTPPLPPEKPPSAPEKKLGLSSAPKEKKWIPPSFEIDFVDLSSRVRRISLPNSKETDPFWHSGSNKLGFTSDWKGDRGGIARWDRQARGHRA